MMKFKLLTIIGLSFCFLQSYCQRGDNFYVVRVHTDSGIVKGNLSTILDSSIEVTEIKSMKTMLLPVSGINYLKVKQPFLITTSTYSFGLSVIGAALVSGYYLSDRYSYSDPSFGRALWQTMVAGAGIGFIWGSVESLFTRKRISIHKQQYIFENKKPKLNKYIHY